jgi:hypothetical protein
MATTPNRSIGATTQYANTCRMNKPN